MIIICPAISDVIDIIGKQSCLTNNKRESSFCVKHNLKKGCLFYNTFTKELLFVDNDDDSNIVQNYLFENWFLVDELFDEVAFYDKFLFLYKKIKTFDNGYLSYTILTTTDCNARCFYCYEKGMHTHTMTIDTASEIANYIVKTCAVDKEIELLWFGGEPLVNYKVIDVICNILDEQNITYKSSMVTNGFLFENSLMAKLKMWHINGAQITLDGTESMYNKVKSYVLDKQQNPYHVVIDNIRTLLENDIKISIRINVGKHNVQNIPLLIDELNSKFKGFNNLKVYCSMLDQEMREAKNRIKFAEIVDKMNHKIRTQTSLGTDVKNLLSKRVYMYKCMADSVDSIAILPDGKLSKCIGSAAKLMYGHIYNERMEDNVVNFYREQKQKQPECYKCFMYPECIRLKICPSCIPQCCEADRMMDKNRIIEAMLNEFNDYMK